MTNTTIDAVDLISRDALFGNPERAGVQISPDGRYLSWLAPLEGVLNIWVAPADDLSAAEAITRDDTRGIRQYFWTYQPHTLVYLRDDGGDEDFHLHRVDVRTREATDLTPFPEVTAQVSGVSDRIPEAILVGINDRDARWHDLYRVELASGDRELLVRNTEGFAGFLADHDYVVRYAMRTRPDGGMDILARDGEDWQVAEDVPFEDAMSTYAAGLTADGSTLYLVDSRGRNTSGLYALDLASGARSLVHADERTDIAGALAHPTTGRIQAVAVNYLREEWTVVDPEVGPDLDVLAGVGPGEISVTSRTLADDVWIAAYSSATEPMTYYRYDRPQRRLTRLFSGRPALEGAPLVPMHPVEITARDGHTLVSYLTLPAHRAADDGASRAGQLAAATGPVPMVLFVHGGPWSRDAYGYDAYVQWLANRGYAVLQVNYRGSTGFGKEFINIADGQWGAAMHEDLLDAVDWAVREGITAQDTVGIMGGSYGGYATLAGLTMTPTTFACGVDIVGPSNLNTLIETVPPYWASFFEQIARRIGDPRTEAGKALLDERSPLTHVDNIVRPLLIGQGANDPRVKQTESDQIVESMSAKGIPVTYVLFPDEGHGFARPENDKAFNAIAEGFLAEHLGGRAEPLGGDLTGSSATVPTGADGVAGLADALANHEPVLRA
ncbi:alpha/beta fold hydrolase [Pseudactinotalea sp. Z1732]|uniref:S9 family peptidase n=1 Tax=Micrococcales TaxID=85006 RepID=UPI003C7D0B14